MSREICTEIGSIPLLKWVQPHCVAIQTASLYMAGDFCVDVENAVDISQADDLVRSFVQRATLAQSDTCKSPGRTGWFGRFADTGRKSRQTASTTGRTLSPAAVVGVGNHLRRRKKYLSSPGGAGRDVWPLAATVRQVDERGPGTRGCKPGPTSADVSAQVAYRQKRSWVGVYLTETQASGAAGAAARTRGSFRLP